MGKFGIGARVRDTDGDEGVVVNKRKGERQVQYDKFSDDFWMWWKKSELTAISTDACAEKGEVAYNVGDRVVFLDEGGPEGCVGTVIVADVDNTYDVKFDEWSGGHSGDSRDGTDSHWWAEAYQIAPFRLEAGRYYKTRDGQKVGPMEEYCEGFIQRLGDGMKWNDDGSRVNRSHEDIVAEWVEPEAKAAPAPEPEPATKFKVGDRIRRVRDGAAWAPLGFEAVVQEGHTYTDKGGGAGFRIYEDQWELVPQAPKFKVGDRVVAKMGTVMLHVGQEYEILRYNGNGGPVVRVYTSSGHPYEYDYGDDWFELATPPLLIGQAVTATGYISGANGNNFSVVFGDKSYDLPATSLKKAA